MTGYALERDLNGRQAGGATFSPDGDRVALRMDTTGTDQGWSLGAPGAWPDQLTFYGERVTVSENTGEWRRALREAGYGGLAADRECLERISPANNIDRLRATLLVAHGENDPRIPVDETRQITTRAREHVPVETPLFDDEGHGFTKLENRLEVYSAIAEFLETHV